MNAALAANAAPDAPCTGISTASSASPVTSDTNGANDDRPGNDAATSAFVKTASATAPITPGSSSRNGVTEPSKLAPKTAGIRNGPTTAARATLSVVPTSAERKVSSVRA